MRDKNLQGNFGYKITKEKLFIANGIRASQGAGSGILLDNDYANNGYISWLFNKIFQPSGFFLRIIFSNALYATIQYLTDAHKTQSYNFYQIKQYKFYRNKYQCCSWN